MSSNPEKQELRFKGMLARIFSDGVVTPEERAELDAALTSGELPIERAAAVILDFVAKSFSHFTADGQITESERAKLRLIVSELHLPEDAVPDAVRRALAK